MHFNTDDMTGQTTRPNDKVVVKIDYLPSVNYSMMNSGIDVCNALVLENGDDQDWYHLSVEISGQYKETISMYNKNY